MEKATNHGCVYDTTEPLYKISKSLQLWPYRYGKSYDIISLTKTNKVISYILNAVIATYVVGAIYGKITFVHRGYLTVEAFSDIALETPLFLLAFISVALSNSDLHNNLVKKFYKELDNIDRNVLHLSAIAHSKIKKQLKAEIIILYVVNLLFQLIDIGMFVRLDGCSQLPYFIGSYIAHSFLVVVFFQIKHEANMLYRYFEIINKRLNSLSFPSKIACIKFENEETDFKEKAIYVRRLCLTYKRLCNLIGNTNDVHGVQIILLIWCIISIAIRTLLYGLMLCYRNESEEKKLEIYIQVFNQVFVFLLHFVIVVMLARQCSITSKEALKSSSIANEKSLEVSLNDTTNSIRLYRRQLKILNREAYCCQPTFSAADSFTINYSLVLSVIGAICTYLIILLQFY